MRNDIHEGDSHEESRLRSAGSGQFLDEELANSEMTYRDRFMKFSPFMRELIAEGLAFESERSQDDTTIETFKGHDKQSRFRRVANDLIIAYEGHGFRAEHLGELVTWLTNGMCASD